MAGTGKDQFDPHKNPGPGRLAWRSAVAVTVFLAITIVALTADLWSKHAVFSLLLSDPNVPIRVQAIKKADRGAIYFGTEVFSQADRSLAALLGASPGASVAVNTASILGSWMRSSRDS